MELMETNETVFLSMVSKNYRAIYKEYAGAKLNYYRSPKLLINILMKNGELL